MLEHQLPFVAALRAGPKMRKHMFDAIEQRATHDFWKGKVGIEFMKTCCQLSATQECRKRSRSLRTAFSHLLIQPKRAATQTLLQERR